MIVPFKIYELSIIEVMELSILFIIVLQILRILPFILEAPPKKCSFYYKVIALNFVAFMVLMFVLSMLHILRLLRSGWFF